MNWAGAACGTGGPFSLGEVVRVFASPRRSRDVSIRAGAEHSSASAVGSPSLMSLHVPACP